MLSEQSGNKLASTAAYLGSGLFAVLLVLFSSVAEPVPVALVGVAFHLILFPVVASLRSSEWIRAAGYSWLALDTILNIAGLNGVDQHTLMSLRLGGHVLAAVWIIGSSLEASRTMRAVGILQGVFFAGYSLAAPWVPNWGLYPSALLLVLWLFLAGRHLSSAVPEHAN